jgi:cytochrome c553
VKQRFGIVVLAIVCFALGAVVQRFYDARRPQGRQQTVQVVKPLPEPNIPAGEDKGGVSFEAIRFDHEPLWAYGFDRPPAPGEMALPQAPPTRNLRPNEDRVEQTRPRRIQGSSAVFSLVDIRDGQNVIDWFPGEHPSMPDVVAHGPARLGVATRGCASCHLPSGKGRPENAAPVGLPATYFMRQLQDFRSGLRRTADPRKPNTNTMIELAKAMTDEEMKASAEYFGSMTFTPWVRVVETNLVPKTRIAGNLFLPIEQARTEPIAGRIIEVPENEEQSETYRNPHSGFIAYVPVGSTEKGHDLVTTGGMRIVGDRIVQGKTTACGTCHGLDLMGVADVPPIAGRSPSYTVRQLWDIQQGTRHGASAQLMKLIVANLTEQDMVSIAAYVASRIPTRAAAPATQTARLSPTP